ncbi:uncharacterized protein FA14DRAFT_175250 [Meira miltonrushii]|uniref:Uncharacterized protein n=1 Tax=Meira miltonrushii TaxID=1280837 RepID=A0A316V5T6_9BASI|nr:uncharacterized protein FA14DRAFT_175250 [Meira miltonrushii]PWN31563.1 hypothetical protein FA14DRAFT_175250 [Meira miltonrushii]
MRSLAFFVIPISAIFLLVSLGLVADGVAGLSQLVKYYSNLGDFSSGGGGVGGEIGGLTSSYRPAYSTQYSDGGGVFGSAFSTYDPYTYSSFDPDLYSTYDYDSALSSIYSKYSFTFRKREAEPTGIAKREEKRASPTVAPVVRQIPHYTPAPLTKREQRTHVEHTLQKRKIFTVSQAKSRTAAILAFYVLQLVTIVALLATGIAFMITFRKQDNHVQEKITSSQNNNIHANTNDLPQSNQMQDASSSIYKRTTLFKKFFLVFAIFTVLYFIFGIVSFGLLGSLGPIVAIAAATVAFWVFAFLACVAICVTLVLDRRTSEEDETSLRNPSFDGGEYGSSKGDGMIVTSSQGHNLQPVSMPQPQQPQTPAGWQQSTAEHQQQYATGAISQPQQQSVNQTAVAPESHPTSPQQQQQAAGPIDGQVYRAVVDQHGNTQMVPVNL